MIHHSKEIHHLTGLRGMAALIVFISHAANKGYLPGYLGNGFGQIGLMIFFVLSGFLMAHLYLERTCNFQKVSHYALARIGRIFPLYFAVVIISFVISNYLFTEFLFDFREIDTFLLAIFFVTSPYTLWTIPVEVQFYVIFVVFWWLFQKNESGWKFWVFGFLVCVPTVIYSVFHEKIIGNNSKVLFSFFVGVLTSLIYNKINRTNKLKKMADFAGLPLLILLLINLPSFRRYFGLYWSPKIYFRTWLDPVTWVLVYGTFWCALLNSKTLNFLNWRPFVFIGGISYGFYLFHAPILEHGMHLPGTPIAKFVIIFLATTLISFMSFWLYEKPISLHIRNLRAFQKTVVGKD
jgi:peptidoglycan/LPS O-acetylase OafA/YrhL